MTGMVEERKRIESRGRKSARLAYDGTSSDQRRTNRLGSTGGLGLDRGFMTKDRLGMRAREAAVWDTGVEWERQKRREEIVKRETLTLKNGDGERGPSKAKRNS